MRRLLPILTLLIVAGALALAGCGGGSSDNSSTTSTGSSSSGGGSVGTTTSSGGGKGPVAVQMKDIAFAPTSVTVKVGQKITWTNDDTVQHDVVSTSGEKIKSDLFGKGGTFSFTPTKAGTIKYVCTVHPGMDGTILVVKK